MSWHARISDNLVWKVISVLLATLIWFIIRFGFQERLSPGARRNFNGLPITVMATANEARAFQVDPGVVDVTVRGEPGLLRSLQPSDIAVFVNLTGILDAKSLRKKVEVHPPAGVTLVWVAPTDVKVEARLTPDTPPRPQSNP
ncbi:MAG: hypothetical protein FJ387_14460 [Verrucomicrobia bacterium]|nr:hypothetical protein [Verrucomicrobiota bacterium]